MLKDKLAISLSRFLREDSYRKALDVRHWLFGKGVGSQQALQFAQKL